MDYNKINKKVDLKFNKKFKYIMTILCLTLILMISVTSPKLVNAYSNGDENNKSSFYIKILNYTLPTVKVISSDTLSTPSFKEKFLEKLGLKNNLSKFILKKEIASIDKNKEKEDPKGTEDKIYDEEGKLVIDPFKLEEKEVHKNVVDNDASKKNTTNPTYDPKLKKELNVNKPEILIYHTHTCESFKPGKSSDENQKINICSVGDVITNELMQNYGICVIHDKTVHDYIYNRDCYKRSGVTVDKYLKKYGDFKLILDLHRDAVKDKSAITTKINGEEVARIMFVIDESNPLVKNNLALTNKLISICDRLYPNLLRNQKICYYTRGMGHFNQNKSKNSVLIEMGSDVSTTEEAQRTGRYVARIIAEYINGKQ